MIFYFILVDVVSWSASLTVTWLSCAKTVERIEVLFGTKILGYARHIALNWGPNPVPTPRGPVSRKTTLPSIKYRNTARIRGGFCHITSAGCWIHAVAVMAECLC